MKYLQPAVGIEKISSATHVRVLSLFSANTTGENTRGAAVQVRERPVSARLSQLHRPPGGSIRSTPPPSAIVLLYVTHMF